MRMYTQFRYMVTYTSPLHDFASTYAVVYSSPVVCTPAYGDQTNDRSVHYSLD